MNKAEMIQQTAAELDRAFSLHEIADTVGCTYARVREVLVVTKRAEKIAHGQYRLVGTDFEPATEKRERSSEPRQVKPRPESDTPAGGISDAQIYKAVVENEDDFSEIPADWVERALAYAKRTKKRAPKRS